MDMTVWVDAWQMQCCGEQFGIRSRVSWTLGEADRDWLATMLGDGVTVDAAEEHHGGVPEGTPETTGTVTAISAVHCRYAPSPGDGGRTLYPVGLSAVLTSVTKAHGRTPDR